MARRHNGQELDASVPANFQRIYVGSLDYFAKPADVEELLVGTNLDSFQKIHISIDPISGRNPGYCFVDFPSHQEAAHALEALAGRSVLGRVVKLGPCRWGDWKGSDDVQGQKDGYSNKESTRIRIDGLDKMVDQEHNDSEIRSFFAGFEVVAIGKRVIPYSLRSTPGNHHHCYVDLSSRQELDRAIKELNGSAMNGVPVRLSIARHGGGPNRYGQSQSPGGGSRIEHKTREGLGTGRDIMQKGSWRRVGDS
ncbi:hypothetical protein QBC41DRAFT_356879 [Cercophora samala]|uniref:RRM domain-containing protein n=1 Tax=Cercophora samala TaxID=330535 RepID=A0AA40DBL5_9PEZI|nr:hypothetical protein QBC41DRAFT_356879 [Cercophora samala]